jgi:hypothetical protein
MAETDSLRAKIAECKRLLDGSDDPLARGVYLAMLNEFVGKLSAVRARIVERPVRTLSFRGQAALQMSLRGSRYRVITSSTDCSANR